MHLIHPAMWLMAAHGLRICGGFMGIGGSSSKTDRNNLNSVFNTGLSQGTQSLNAGQAATGSAQDYWSKLLGGNRSSITQALSPEINTVTGQANQNKKQQAAMGTARGGGTNSQNQQQQQTTEAQVNNLVSQARPQAAQQLQGIGAQQLATGGNLLGLGANAVESMYPTDVKNNQQQGQAAGQLAAALLFGV